MRIGRQCQQTLNHGRNYAFENPCPGFFFDHCQTVKSLTLRQCNFYGSILTGSFLLPIDTAHQIFVNRKLPLALYRKTRWYFLIYNSQIIHNTESGLLMEEEKVPACTRTALKEYWIRPRVPMRLSKT